MEDFIQKYLSCRNIENYGDLINCFPIIYVKLNNQMKRLLIYHFTNNRIPNYIVIGKYDENFVFDKEDFIGWLENLNFLIHFNLKSGITKEYIYRLQNFKNSIYFSKLKFTQEGFDIVNNKHLFIPTGNIQRTVIVNIKVENDGLVFSNRCYFDSTNKFLLGDFFQNYSEYEKKYFLNQKEMTVMGYYDVLDFAKLNMWRIADATNNGNLKKMIQNNADLVTNKQNQIFLLQVLDFAISQETENSKQEKLL